MKKVICMALTLLLCLSALNPFPAVASDPLADAFQGSGRIILEETNWQGMPDPEVLKNATLGFLDLSPDGKTMLCLQAEETPTGDAIGYHLSLIRDKEIIPVTVNAGRGDGDPYGKIEMTGALLRDLPLNARLYITDSSSDLMAFSVFANEKIPADDPSALPNLSCRWKNTLFLITCEDEQPDGSYAFRRVITAGQL